MLRENSKWKPHKDESTDAEHRGGSARSSDEVSVMEMERRGGRAKCKWEVNHLMGGTFGLHKFSRRLNGMKSRMNREVHVRNCESLRGKFPRATRPCGVLREKTPWLPICCSNTPLMPLLN